MKKISYILLFTFLVANAGSISLQQEHYDFNGKFEDERTTLFSAKEKIGDVTLIGSVADVYRFGLNDQQYGAEVYSKIGPKEWNSYGYLAVYTSPSSKFLPRTDLSAGIYKGVGRGFELGAGYKRMNFENNGVDIFRTSISAPVPIISSFSIAETLTFVPANNTSSLESKVIFNNEKNIEFYYAYSFGNSAENLGFAGIVKNNRTVHSVGATYEIDSHFNAGFSLMRENYENFYLKEGGSIFVGYAW